MCRRTVEDSRKLNKDETWHVKYSVCSDLLWTWEQEITGSFKNWTNHNKKIITTSDKEMWNLLNFIKKNASVYLKSMCNMRYFVNKGQNKYDFDRETRTSNTSMHKLKTEGEIIRSLFCTMGKGKRWGGI